MKSIMRAAIVLAAIISTAPGAAYAQQTTCGVLCGGAGQAGTNTGSPTPSRSDDAAKMMGEMLGDQTLATVTTTVTTNASLDEPTRSTFVTGMTTANGALDSFVKPTIEGVMSNGTTLSSSVGSGAGTLGGGGSMTTGPLGALGGVLSGVVQGH